MNGNSSKENNSYRKGLVLGFTMAEIILLLIFAVLLALSAIIIQKKSELDDQLIKTKVAEENFKALQNKILKRTNGGANNIDDFFNHLTLAEEKASEYENLKKQVDALEEAKKIIDNIKKNIVGQTKTDVNQAEVENLITDAVNDLLRSQKVSTDNTLNLLTDKMSKISNLQGQIKNLQTNLDQCKGLGKGASYPPCWAEVDTGKPEFIYDIGITDKGFILKLCNLPHRKNDLINLPISDIKMDKEIGLSDFLTSTLPLFKYSQKENCRFFVKLYDKTGPTQKEIYKKHRTAVESRFYTRIMQEND